MTPMRLSPRLERRLIRRIIPGAARPKSLPCSQEHEQSFIRQCVILFQKRLAIIHRNHLPYLAAFLIPIIAAALVNLFLKNYPGTGCSLPDQVAPSNIESILTQRTVKLVREPAASVTHEDLAHLGSLYPTVLGNASSLAASISTSASNTSLQLPESIILVDSINDFHNYML